MYSNNELHTHTDASLGDGGQTVCELIDEAIEKGATAVAITDHGVCTNWIDFYNYCNGDEVNHKVAAKKIKPILGVEAYITRSFAIASEEKIIRQHCIFLAKDYKGLQDISRFVSATNRNFDDKEKPVGDIEMIEKYLCNGNVICLSACIAGVIATPLRYNEYVDKEILKIQNRINKSLDTMPGNISAARRADAKAQKIIDEKKSIIDSLSSVANKKYRDTINSIKKMEDEEKKNLLLEQVEIEKIETKKAKEEIKEIKAEIAKIKENVREQHALCMKNKKKLQTIDANYQLIQELNDNKKSTMELLNDAKTTALLYQKLFGDDFYLEVQYHGIESEAIVFPQIVSLARELNIPLVATNDVHFAKRGGEIRRNYLRNAATLKWGWEDYEDFDKELFYKNGDELANSLLLILDEDAVSEAMTNIDVVVSKCNLTLSEAKHYPEFEDADIRLRELAETGYTKAYVKDSDVFVEIKADGVHKRYPDFDEDKKKRFEYELSIISQMNFSSYFLFIADVISVCKRARSNALDIGPGRGSGAGSMICYCCNITEIEPLSQNLLFERFLNPNRVSMPDVDTDFSAFAREYAIAYVTEKYGSNAVAGIMTKAKMGTKSAIDYASKLYAIERGLDKMIYSDKAVALKKFLGDKNIHSMKEDVDREFSDDEISLGIYQIATLIEGYYTSYGQHAAAVIAIQKDSIEDFIPLIKTTDEKGNVDEKLAIQADMVQAEAQLGFIKFDFLGLKNLNVITRCMELVLKNHNKEIIPYKMDPIDENVYREIFAKADTDFVFQFESDGMKGMLKQLNPTCFEDIVLAVSVYRPGPMDFIPDIICSKDTGKKSDFIEKIPILEEILAPTYGYPVYQEQVMQIMTTAAGFDLGRADNVRRFMSKKKEDKLAAEKPAFVEGCINNGISKEDATWLFEQLMPFAKYGFNKSHAAAYSFISYITAYLKHYYPEEYLCAAMLEQGDKTFQMVRNCNNYGITLLPPDVNLSEKDYTTSESKIIRIGLVAIKGFANASDSIIDERKLNGPFVNLKDFIKRTHLKKNEYEALILSGACDSLVSIANRDDMIKYCHNCIELLSEIDDAKNESTKLELINQFNSIKLKSISPTSLSDSCTMEFEKLGMFLSGNPLDDYLLDGVLPEEDGNFSKVGGIVTNYNAFKTKKTGDNMASFDFTDKDGNNISSVIFPRQFKSYEHLLDDSAIVAISGEIRTDDERGTQIIVDEIFPLSKRENAKTIVVSTISQMFEFSKKISTCKDGSPFYVEILEKQSKDILYLSPEMVEKIQEIGCEIV